MPPQVSAVVLAAGSSARMGSSKQLLPLGPKPVIRHCLDSVIDAGIKDVVVVIGAGGSEIAAAIDGLPVSIAVNDDSSGDMASSVRQGLRAIDPASAGVLVCLSDHPLVAADTIATIVSAHHAASDRIIIPLHNARRGHPTLFPRVVIEEIFFSPTLRDVIAANAGLVRTIEVGDEGVILDLDTPEEYGRIKGRFA
ncbi:MAG: nucleotidyltransferase family protein [Nitrospirota bacterium]